MKNKIVLFITGGISLLLISCLGSGDYDYNVVKDCQIVSFSLSSDSVPGLEDVIFSIDQIEGKIFNFDSMAYGTKIEKVIASLNFGSGFIAAQVVQENQMGQKEDDGTLKNDTIWWGQTDSLDFAKRVFFITYAYDGITKKTYTAQVNIHQVQPDSMAWMRYDEPLTGIRMTDQKVILRQDEGEQAYYMFVNPRDEDDGYLLYTSKDARHWSRQSLSGLTKNEAILAQITEYQGCLYMPTTKGVLYKSTDGRSWSPVDKSPYVKTLLGSFVSGTSHKTSLLAGICQNEGINRFAAMKEDGSWIEGDQVPEEFPVTGFATVTNAAMYAERITIVGGRSDKQTLVNTSWATDNGTGWWLLTNQGNPSYFPEQEGMMLTKYDDKLFLISGDHLGNTSKDMFTSIDGATTWQAADTLLILPEAYKARGFGSIIVDKENMLYIFGGKENNVPTVLDELWYGRINRLGFKK